MRVIHTADWHIGQTLAGYGRDHEHRAVLADLVRIAAEREADALIIAGDIFDHQNPSGDAQRLFYETLVALKAARPSMAIVVTAGNHDAAGRLEAPRVLLAPAGVHIIGSVRRSGSAIEADRHVIALQDPSGKTAAHVLAVSYPTAACLPALALAGEGTSPVVAATRTLYAELHTATRARTNGLPLIVTGHLHVAGGTESEGAERHILVGGQHAVPPDVFPSDAAYVALGHLHKAQQIGGDRVRYSGSLLPLSATELGYIHGVTLLTLDQRGVTDMEHIPVVRPVPFRRVPERGYAIAGDVGRLLDALGVAPDCPPNEQPFVQVWLAREGVNAGTRGAVAQQAEGARVRLVDPVRIEPPPAGSLEVGRDATERLADVSPYDLFRQAFERAHGRLPDPRHEAAFHRALAAAEAQS